MTKEYKELQKKSEEIQKKYDKDMKNIEDKMKKCSIEIYEWVVQEVGKYGYIANPTANPRPNVNFIHKDFHKNFSLYGSDYISSKHIQDKKIDNIMKKAGFQKINSKKK